MPLFSDTEFSDISARPCLACAGFSRLGNDAKKSISPAFTDNMDFILQSVFYFVTMRSANASASSICAQKYSLPIRLSKPAFSIICIGCSFT